MDCPSCDGSLVAAAQLLPCAHIVCQECGTAAEAVHNPLCPVCTQHIQHVSNFEVAVDNAATNSNLDACGSAWCKGVVYDHWHAHGSGCQNCVRLCGGTPAGTLSLLCGVCDVVLEATAVALQDVDAERERVRQQHASRIAAIDVNLEDMIASLRKVRDTEVAASEQSLNWEEV